MVDNKYQKDLEDIFLSGVNRVDPYKMLKNFVKLKNNILTINIEFEKRQFDLTKFDNIFVFGAGKASLKMAKAIEEILGDKITEGIISVKFAGAEKLKKIEIIESGHPIPNNSSIKSAEKIKEISKKISDKTLAINLISGGGSALLESLVEYMDAYEKISLTLDDLQKTTKALLDCGANIDEINCIRKHISTIKGGKLAEILYPAASINFILSDVVGDHLGSIASGLTSYDDTTFLDAFAIIKKYEIEEIIPSNIIKIIQYGIKNKIEETPKENNKIFLNVNNILIGTNQTSLLAASKKAEELGYNSIIISSQITGEAKETAKFLLAVAKDIYKYELLAKRPACVIAGGETTVTIRGNGKGGRNQEMALSFLNEIKKEKKLFEDIYFLAASTDGSDGPTDAAGAFSTLEILEKSFNLNLKIEEYLKNNDSYNFFEKTDGLFKTGSTNTNVCDIQLIIIS